uniref:DUF4770 domain-containing protein n=1 Tax=Megaselia scalaris TaxID=36166 RepID=T1GX88_MEGSC
MSSKPEKFTINYPKLVKEFMRELDLPKWYRGLSSFQLEAASTLHLNLRDDMQQETTHRTRGCLLQLGLDPPVPHKNIKLVMKLSKGQDMAFLWFLMDLYYKNACDNCAHTVDVYNINEQICFSAIAHLDMITTLREMDYRLPKQPYKYKGFKKPEPKKESQHRNINPYLQKLVKPNPPKVKKFDAGSKIVPNFSEYKSYSDIYYVVPNEKNRWFTEYKFQKGKRFLNKIINDVINEIFNCLQSGYTMEFLLKTKYKDTFCLTHRFCEEQKALRKAQKIVRIKETLTAYLDVAEGRKEQSKKRVARGLTKEVDTIQTNDCKKPPRKPLPFPQTSSFLIKN